jgi:predicted XRE-type DNA-binding protein
MRATVRPSSGNVFKDLGFPPREAENLRVRAALMAALRKLIQDRGLTQAAAAGVLGVTQPRVSDLVRGRIELFSIDALVSMLANAGLRVRLIVSGARRRGVA